MAQKSEFKVLQENNSVKLGAELNGLAAQGWRPILMTTVTLQAGVPAGVIMTTVILEHIIGS
jgi:hypothetical protein